jgi:hypothetical protein
MQRAFLRVVFCLILTFCFRPQLLLGFITVPIFSFNTRTLFRLTLRPAALRVVFLFQGLGSLSGACWLLRLKVIGQT